MIHGYSDGKKTTDTRIIQPKNVGKKNETAPWNQGLSEAESKENKKRDEGYLDTLEEVESTEIALPMLAQKYTERKHYLKYPCYVQPKLNGVRCVGRRDIQANVNYVSRKGKLFTTLGHINEEVEKFIDSLGPSDGEIFHPEWSFQEIVRALKKERDTTPELEYWIYDLVDPKTTFQERHNKIWKFFNEYSETKNSLGFRTYGKLVEVPTVLIENEKAFKTQHKNYTKNGFEGTILRNTDGLYLLKYRSNDLLKYKDFLDAEFEIIGGKEATGNDSGTVVFRVKTKNGKEFDVRPKGSRELRKEWFNHLDDLIGKELTVRYQELSEDGIPIFPVGIEIRDYE